MPIDFAKGIATSVVNTGLRKVAGNLPGLLGRNKGKQGARDSSDLKDLENARSVPFVSPKLLQFPSDIDSDPGVGNHGHYIIFYINEFAKTGLKFGDFVPEEGKKNLAKAEAEMGLSDKVKQTKTLGGQVQTLSVSELAKQGLQKGKNLLSDAQGFVKENFIKTETVQNQLKDDTVIQRKQNGGYSQVNHNYGTTVLSNTNNSKDTKPKDPAAVEFQEDLEANYKGNNVRITMPSRKRLDTAIALYMPAQVQVTYGAKYTDTEISALSGALGQAVGDMSAGASLSDTYNKVIPMVTEGLQKTALLKGADLLDGIGISGAREAIEIGRAEVIADSLHR